MQSYRYRYIYRYSLKTTAVTSFDIFASLAVVSNIYDYVGHRYRYNCQKTALVPNILNANLIQIQLKPQIHFYAQKRID